MSDDVARPVLAIPLSEKAVDGLLFRLSFDELQIQQLFDSPNSVVVKSPPGPLVITELERKTGGISPEVQLSSRSLLRSHELGRTRRCHRFPGSDHDGHSLRRRPCEQSSLLPYGAGIMS